MEEHRSGFRIVLSSKTSFIVQRRGGGASFGVLTILLVVAVGGGHREETWTVIGGEREGKCRRKFWAAVVLEA